MFRFSVPKIFFFFLLFSLMQRKNSRNLNSISFSISAVDSFKQAQIRIKMFPLEDQSHETLFSMQCNGEKKIA